MADVDTSRYESDNLISYEAGMKADIGAAARLNATLLYIDLDGIQQRIQLTCGFQFRGNFGAARSQGVELELTEAPAVLLDEMTETAAVLPANRAAALLEDATRHDFRGLSKQVAERMAIMQILRKDWADAAKRWIGVSQPRARVEVLGGHLMPVEYPAAFNAMVLSFLGGSRLSTTRRSRHSRSRWCARPDPRPRTR